MTDRTPILTRAEVRALDAHVAEKFHIPGMVLMENAGRGVADVLCREMGAEQGADPGDVLIFCGPGNNGGDGLVAARHLAVRGIRAYSVMCVDPERPRGDARQQFEIARALGLPLVPMCLAGDELACCEMLWRVCQSLRLDRLWIVDALLGTGAVGVPRAPMDAVITWMNSVGRPILAVDAPSGLDCDTGLPFDPTGRVVVRATVTCTLAALKPGLLLPEARERYVGRLELADIGVPDVGGVDVGGSDAEVGHAHSGS